MRRALIARLAAVRVHEDGIVDALHRSRPRGALAVIICARMRLLGTELRRRRPRRRSAARLLALHLGLQLGLSLHRCVDVRLRRLDVSSKLGLAPRSLRPSLCHSIVLELRVARERLDNGLGYGGCGSGTVILGHEVERAQHMVDLQRLCKDGCTLFADWVSTHVK